MELPPGVLDQHGLLPSPFDTILRKGALAMLDLSGYLILPLGDGALGRGHGVGEPNPSSSIQSLSAGCTSPSQQSKERYGDLTWSLGLCL